MPTAFQGLRDFKVHFNFQFLSAPACVLSLSVNFGDSTERIRGRVTGKECSAIYLDSRAPILVLSGFLCHLRQTKVKCFCLVNISVIWTAALPHWGTGGFLQVPLSQSNCISIWWFSGEGQLQRVWALTNISREALSSLETPIWARCPHFCMLLWP